MSLAYDDPDGDDEFGDMHTTVLDVASRSVIGGKAMSPGFQTWTHDHSEMIGSTYKGGMPGPGMMMGGNKAFAIFDDNGQNLITSDALPSGMLGTQQSLSADDGTLVFVVPSTVSGYGISMAGDHHFFGGSLYLASYNTTTNALGTPVPLIQSTGTAPSATNFYYPDIAPNNSFVVFNEAPSGDAFYNVNARVKLLHNPSVANAQPIDLPALNVADGLTNSWPRWSPVVQTYKGHKILWVTFSSNRDYGLHLTNKGFPNCYPPESPSYDTPQPLSKQGVTYTDCAQPQNLDGGRHRRPGSLPRREGPQLPRLLAAVPGRDLAQPLAAVGPANPGQPDARRRHARQRRTRRRQLEQHHLQHQHLLQRRLHLRRGRREVRGELAALLHGHGVLPRDLRARVRAVTPRRRSSTA